MSLTISVVTWNSEKTIRQCIESILLQTYDQFELIINDNDSKDETCTIISQISDPRMRLIKSEKNTGFCGGHNRIIRETFSEFVLLVNPDVILSGDYVETVMDCMAASPNIGTVCGLLLQNGFEESKIDSGGMEFTKYSTMKLRYHGVEYGSVSLKREMVFGADGALPLYRRKMIDDLSFDGEFFDELFFAHKEDWDIAWRSNLLGWKTLFEPKALALHPRHFQPGNLKKRQTISGQIRLHAVKNQLILQLKNETWLSFLKHFIFFVPRQITIFIYIIFFERESLTAYSIVFRNLNLILKKRQAIMAKAKKANRIDNVA